MNDKIWLQNLKVGDKVIVSGNNSFGSDRIYKVARLTKTQIITTLGDSIYEYKFNRETGRSISNDSWSTTYLYEATSEKVNEIFLKNSQYKIKHYVTEKINWNIVPKEVIDQLYVLLDLYAKQDAQENH